eukprot:373590-Prorocentrum_minimum.AAC.1
MHSTLQGPFLPPILNSLCGVPPRGTPQWRWRRRRRQRKRSTTCTVPFWTGPPSKSSATPARCPFE